MLILSIRREIPLLALVHLTYVFIMRLLEAIYCSTDLFLLALGKLESGWSVDVLNTGWGLDILDSGWSSLEGGVLGSGWGHAESNVESVKTTSVPFGNIGHHGVPFSEQSPHDNLFLHWNQFIHVGIGNLSVDLTTPVLPWHRYQPGFFKTESLLLVHEWSISDELLVSWDQGGGGVTEGWHSGEGGWYSGGYSSSWNKHTGGV